MKIVVGGFGNFFDHLCYRKMKNPKSLAFATVSAVSLAMLLAGCSSENNAADQVDPAASVDRTVLVPPPASASLEQETDEVLEFTYGYPAEAAAIPTLAAFFDADRAEKLAETRKEAQADAAQAKANDFPVRGHIFSQKWVKTAQTPRFLSLSSDIETYTGGAHGMVNFDSLLWDREKNESVKPLDIFTSTAAFDMAASRSFCAAINAAKKEKGIAPNTDPDGTFEVCPKISEQTLWLGSSDGQIIDRMTIGIPAYVVGPYAEGNYRIDLPLTADIARTVKPEYVSVVRPAN